MRKKLVSVGIGLMSVCMMSAPATKTHAAEMPAMQSQDVRMETYLGVPDNNLEGRLPEGNEAKGLFTTKYRVSVSKATMRSGPGTNYSSLGTLYKNDVVWVQSISNGWAKFKVNSKWHYISESCIKKATY